MSACTFRKWIWGTCRVTYSNRLESSFNTACEEMYQFEEIAKEIDIVHFAELHLR